MAEITEGVLREELATQEEQLAHAKESLEAAKAGVRFFRQQVYALEQMSEFSRHLLKRLAEPESPPADKPEEGAEAAAASLERRAPAGAEEDAALMAAGGTGDADGGPDFEQAGVG